MKSSVCSTEQAPTCVIFCIGKRNHKRFFGSRSSRSFLRRCESNSDRVRKGSTVWDIQSTTKQRNAVGIAQQRKRERTGIEPAAPVFTPAPPILKTGPGTSPGHAPSGTLTRIGSRSAQLLFDLHRRRKHERVDRFAEGRGQRWELILADKGEDLEGLFAARKAAKVVLHGQSVDGGFGM